MLTFFKKCDFRGRASEAEYWLWAILPFFVVLPAAELAFAFLGFEYVDDFKFSALNKCGTRGIFLLCAVPALATTVRRLHDVGVSASLVLVPFFVSFAAWVCGVGILAPLAFCVFGICVFGNCIAEGAPEANRFGPPPVRKSRELKELGK